MKHELCPSYCLFDPESENPGVKQTCDACDHSQDVMTEPKLAIDLLANNREVTVIAQNGDKYYILEKMSNGQTSVGRVHKSKIRFI